MNIAPLDGDRVKRLFCADVQPGCAQVITGPDDQAVLDRALAHAAAHHDITRPSMAYIERVVIATHPIIAAARGEQRRLSLVGAADPVLPGAAAAGGGHRVGRRPRPAPRSRGGPAAAGPGAATVTSLTGRPSRAHRTYRHECWLYEGDTEFVEVMAPFIRDGLARDQPVMVAVPQPRLHALRDALGPDSAKVGWADMADLGGNPARIIPAWQDFTDKYRGHRRPIRGIGQPIWPRRGDAELAEAQFHEALLNLAVSPDTPLWLLCPYDTSTLTDGVIDEALRSHPVLAEAGAYRGSTHYGGAHHAKTLFGARLPEPAAPTTAILFDPDRHRHAEQLRRAAAAAGVPEDLAAKFVTAADAIAAASSPVRIRVWQDNDALLCEITDPVQIDDPMTGRSATPAPRSIADRRDHAVRRANQLCDLVQVRSGPDGTTIRVHTRAVPAPGQGRNGRSAPIDTPGDVVR